MVFVIILPMSGPEELRGGIAPNGPGNSDRKAEKGHSSPYLAQMLSIDRALEEGRDAESIPGYVKKGGVCYIFRTHDSNYMKMPRIRPQSEGKKGLVPLPQDIVRREYVIPLLRGRGHEGLEQIVDYIDATSDNLGAVIVEPIEDAKLLSDMSEAERNSIPVRHYQQLINVFSTTARLDIAPDYDSTNIFYNPNAKSTLFTLIDYGVLESGQPSRTPEEAAAIFAY